MNGAELADALATRLGISSAASRGYLEALTAEVTTALVRGDRVAVRGFGVLEPRSRAERRLLHPSTGEETRVRSRRIVVFRAGRELLTALDDAGAVESARSDGDRRPLRGST